MTDIIKIKKGLDINLKGKAEKVFSRVERPAFCALKPLDFQGLVPKLVVKVGDKVEVGTILFFDKYHPEIKYTSPVSGEISEIKRGERRLILELIIKADASDTYVKFNPPSLEELSAADISEILLNSGLWPLIRQRPYSTVALPVSKPKSFFISGFDTSPLAADVEFLLKDKTLEFQKGLDVISKLCETDIHVSHSRNSKSQLFSQLKGVKLHSFEGPHPAGNIGVQIHHIDPINKGEVVWFAGALDVARIGSLFINGILDNSLEIALTGSELIKASYVKTIQGSSVSSLLNDNVKPGEVRIISGNPLTGTKCEKDGFLGYYDRQLTVIPEGNKHEFLGWALPGFDKFSFYRSFFSWLKPSAEYTVDTNLHGGERAFVITGKYEQVIPMDIFPMQLLKAILVEDIDQMENLGIYEVAEEDFALAEFICPSKTEMQSIIRQGLNLMRKEME
jgi:Na+-transporting NADH:ubiquinone oxidoreductase subunit A